MATKHFFSKRSTRRKFTIFLSILCAMVMVMPAYSFAASSGGSGKVSGTIIEYLYFGSYPQTEVVSQPSDSGAYGKEWATENDYIVDADLYAQLSSESAAWDDNGDLTINDSKYHRIKYSDTFYPNNYATAYKWADDTTYHYFKYEPIKWKLLEQDGNNAFLMSDIVLDDQEFNDSFESLNWENSYMREWLSSSFMNRAFTTEEQNAIFTTNVINIDNLTSGTDGGPVTKDKVYLLSESEVYNTSEAVNYGFSSEYAASDTRKTTASTYAKAKGVLSYITDSSCFGNCEWWLRSTGTNDKNAAYVDSYGRACSAGHEFYNTHTGVRPVIHLDLECSELYKSEGRNVEITGDDVTLSETSYTYDGKAKEPEVEISGLKEGTHYTVEYKGNINPGTAKAIITGTGEFSGNVVKTFSIKLPEQSGEMKRSVEYDCVYFGSYPQTEIADTAERSGVYGKVWETTGDYIIDSALYAQLNSETVEWDSNGDVTIGGDKYHRITESDSRFSFSSSTHYSWSRDTEYHYFKYEPIKWRVLEKDGDDLFLMSDIALDSQEYNRSYYKLTWENCTLRSWLNGYGSDKNVKGTDYSGNNFMSKAFSQKEQDAIKLTTLQNDNNISYGTSGGNETQDKIYLLSESEVYTDNARGYGFKSEYTKNDARVAKSSTYAKAMGVAADCDRNYLGNTYWWMRSPGDTAANATCVLTYGTVNQYGINVDDGYVGVRPVLHVDSSAAEMKSAGTTEKFEDIAVNSFAISQDMYVYDDKSYEPKVTISGLTQGKDFSVAYANNDKEGLAEITVTGKGKWSGTLTGYFAIVDTADVQNALCGKHVYGDWTVTKEATCTETGTREKECLICHEKVTETIAAGHESEHYKTSAGYLKNGVEYDKCKKCGEILNKKTIRGYSTSYVKSFKVKKGRKCFTAKWKKQSKKNRKKFSGYQIRYSKYSSMSGAKYKNIGKSKKSIKIKGLAKKTRYYVQLRTYYKGFYSKWSTKSVVTR